MTRIMTRLPHDSTDERERYGMATPDREAHSRAYRATWYGEGPLRREDVIALLAMADSYIDIVESTSARSTKKLRDMRRALRGAR